MKAVLISGRTVEQGTSLEIGKTSAEYFESVAAVELNEDDMRELGVEDGQPVEISTEFGSTVAKCRKASLDRGTAFMPYGPWACMVIGNDTQGTGMPDTKGVEVEISATNKQAPTVTEIVGMVKKG